MFAAAPPSRFFDILVPDNEPDYELTGNSKDVASMMKYFVWSLILALVVLHQDLWNWNNDRLVVGFIPLTLAYHAGLSVAASVVWFLAVKFAWPLHDETEHSEFSSERLA